MYIFFVSQAHSSVEKAGLIGLVKMRFLSSDEKLSLRGETLKTAIEEDIKAGLIPFYVSSYDDRLLSKCNTNLYWFVNRPNH